LESAYLFKPTNITIMSVEIGKIIDVYDQTLSTLEAKNQLFIEDSLISLTTPETPVRSSITKPAY
jgi:hypothetical protein